MYNIKIFTLFRLRKTAVPVEISVSVCLYVPFVISSIPGKSFRFPFPLFVIKILKIYNIKTIKIVAMT